MRSIVVLVLAAALVWAGFEVFKGDAAVGARGPGAGNGEALAGNGGPSNVGTKPTPPPASVPTKPEAPPENPFAAQEAPDFGEPDAWVALAGLLAHEHYDRLRAELGRVEPPLPADRREFLLCFANALDLTADNDAAREHASRLFERDALTEHEIALMACALGNAEPPPGGAHRDALDLAAEIAAVGRAAERSASLGDLPEAARRLSRVFESELVAPWETGRIDLDRRVALLRDVHRRYRWDPRAQWPSFELEVRSGEGLTTIRQRALEARPDLQLSTGLIARANRLDAEVIHPGQILRIPTEPVTVLVDVSKHWLLYRVGTDVVDAFPVGTGARGKETLLGEFVVGTKQKNPTWFPQGRAPIPFGHPDNPLGTRWLGWRLPESDADTSFGFHGTWLPETIGHDESEGCVRLENRDVETLFEILPQGARFRVRA